MFDLGWTEMLVIAIVLIVVVGPKDLPRMLRTFGRTTAKMRAMAGDFRRQFDEALREAELDEVKNLASDVSKLNPTADIKKALNPMQKAAEDVRAGLDAAMNPTKKAEASAATPAAPAAAPSAVSAGTASEGPAPLKNGHDTPAATADKPAVKEAKQTAPQKQAEPKKKAATKTGGKA